MRERDQVQVMTGKYAGQITTVQYVGSGQYNVLTHIDEDHWFREDELSVIDDSGED
jgi:hypothetical protein